MGLLDGLDDEQRAAAEATRGPVCIIAGAGTGKTRTVTHRIAHAVASGQVDGREVLAITHSRKAAGELAERLRALGAGAAESRTFHAAGLRVAGHFWSRTGRPGRSPKVASERDTWRMWRDAARAATRTEPDTAMVRELSDEVAWARSRLIGPDAYEAAAADRQAGLGPAAVVDGWARYNGAKARLGVVDFADLLEIATELIRSDDHVATQVRRRWAYLTVDEYQDTDPAQQELLDAILGSSSDVCVVGDPRQAIYSWKGADPAYLNGFAQRFPAAQTFSLTRNYRSTPQILEWANAIAADRRAPALAPTRPSGPMPKITPCEHEGGEARWVAQAAKRAIAGGTPASEIAVLYRFNATQARFEAALSRAGVASVVAEDTTFFDREEIQAVLVALRRAAAASPDAPGLEVLRATLTRAGFDPDSPPPGQGAARARWESHQALLDLVATSPETATADAAGLAAELDRLAANAHGPKLAGVTLATLHRAKGLEWDIVFVVGVTDGAIPASYATTPDEEAEEERLLYVGMTRARRQLYLTWSATNGRGWTNRPSPYLDRLPPSRPGRHTPRAAKHNQRERGGTPVEAESAACPHCAAPLRGMAARRLGVCAHCVTKAPGPTGELARALEDVIHQASEELGLDPSRLVAGNGLLRLLDRRPTSADGVTATAGVSLPPPWAAAVAHALGG